ncbi:MAG: sigma-E factor negative regulatory protein [Betaproteobacteria bacterium]|nr:sigma-E factor negative regulatory protein [Betaproteobacteria bacterium]
MYTAPQPREDETLSAFFDGELSDEMARSVLRRLDAHPAERRRYDEYCAVSAALRGLPDAVPDLTSRVMAALEREPVVLAPMRRIAPRPPLLWAAAAAVAVLTWSLWSVLPHPQEPLPLAARQPADQALPYLAAHQDYAQAVMSPTEMQFTRVSLAEAGR